MFFVYIIQCADGSLYTGIAKDINHRIKQHNGEIKGGAKYTRGRGPVVLKYYEVQESQSHATQREIEIKGLTRKQKEELILRHKEVKSV